MDPGCSFSRTFQSRSKSGPYYRPGEGSWLKLRRVAHAQRRVARVYANHRFGVCRDSDCMSGRGFWTGDKSHRNHGWPRSINRGDLRRIHQRTGNEPPSHRDLLAPARMSRDSRKLCHCLVTRLRHPGYKTWRDLTHPWGHLSARPGPVPSRGQCWSDCHSYLTSTGALPANPCNRCPCRQARRLRLSIRNHDRRRSLLGI